MQVRIEDAENPGASLAASLPAQLIKSGTIQELTTGVKKSFSGEPMEIVTFIVQLLPELSVGVLSAAFYDMAKRPFSKISVDGKDIKNMTLAEIEHVLAKKNKS